MEICSNDHPEIIHNEGWKNCPLCALKEKHRKEMNDLQYQLDELQGDYYRLVDDLEDEKSRNKALLSGVRP